MTPYEVLVWVAVFLKVTFIILALSYRFELHKKNTKEATKLLEYKDTIELLFTFAICIILLINFRPHRGTIVVDQVTGILLFVYACITLFVTPWTNLPFIKKIQGVVGGYGNEPNGDYAGTVVVNTHSSNISSSSSTSSATFHDVSGVMIERGYLLVSHNGY
jgi:hypothetical protein